jgi:Phosphoenolpyruvate-protein kinase (PTS system EI component in bacteria)
MMKEVKGISASKGIVIGKAFLYLVEDIRIEAKEKDSLPFKEKKKILEKAIENSRKEITDLYERTKAEDGEKEAEIFKAHLLFLEDPMIIDMVDALTNKVFLWLHPWIGHLKRTQRRWNRWKMCTSRREQKTLGMLQKEL